MIISLENIMMISWDIEKGSFRQSTHMVLFNPKEEKGGYSRVIRMWFILEEVFCMYEYKYAQKSW